MKKILITGGTGFIGSHVVDYLLEKTDYEFVLLERMGYSGTLLRLAELNSYQNNRHRVKVVWHDLRSPLNAFVREAIGKPNFIIHMAASTHVDRAIKDPMSFVLDNCVGSENLFEYAKELDSLELLINFSTDEVFGSAEPGVYHKEDDSYNPSNMYAATKAASECFVKAFVTTYHSPFINTHTMNNFGERQHPEKFVPTVIRTIARGEETPIYASVDKEGNILEAGQRVWMYTKNTADAMLFLLNNAKPGEAYNVIGFDELDIVTLANKIATIVGKPLIPKYVGFYGARPGHDRRYALDGTKMKEIGWKPLYDLDQALEQTVKFTLDNPLWLG